MHGRALLGPEAGMSLLEVIVAMSILTIAVVAITGGMMTSVNTEERHRQHAEAQTVLTSASEALKAKPYVSDCSAAPYAFVAGDVVLPGGWDMSNDVHITSIEYSDGGSDFGPTCDSSTRMQRLTITVDSPRGRATEEVAVVKRSEADPV